MSHVDFAAAVYVHFLEVPDELMRDLFTRGFSGRMSGIQQQYFIFLPTPSCRRSIIKAQILLTGTKLG